MNGPHRPAAALHDYLYETQGLGGLFTRKDCDEIFYEAMRSCKKAYWDSYPEEVRLALKQRGFFRVFNNAGRMVDKATAKLIYLGVRIGGGSHFNQ